MSDEQPAVIVKDLYKSFKLPHEQHSGIKQLLVNFAKRKKGYEVQHVLDDVSFEIKKGEFFGIVGRNGSGKSTLLKLLAGIYVPDKGLVQVNGSLTPFIELGVGFNPELTGRENVFMNGAMLGFSHSEMGEMYGDIVDFAEIEKFMDQKLKNYSTGMQVRLAFSIAVRAQSTILLIDEVLAVGDAAFQQKCYDYFADLKKNKQTVVLVTHDMGAVKRFCSRAILIENGKIKAEGSPDKIASQYIIDNIDVAAVDTAKKELHPLVKSIKLIPESPVEISNSKDLNFKIRYELTESTPVDIGISIINQDLSILEQNTIPIKLPYEKNNKYSISYSLPLASFNPGRYRVSIAIFEKKGYKLAGFDTDAFNFVISKEGADRGGVLSLQGVWGVEHGKN